LIVYITYEFGEFLLHQTALLSKMVPLCTN